MPRAETLTELCFALEDCALWLETLAEIDDVPPLARDAAREVAERARAVLAKARGEMP